MCLGLEKLLHSEHRFEDFSGIVIQAVIFTIFFQFILNRPKRRNAAVPSERESSSQAALESSHRK
jgi:hypothetical protein